jgi:hypothetical protein
VDALVGVIGVIVGAVGSLAVGWFLEWRGRDHAARRARLDAAGEVFGSLQELNRRLIDLARADTTDHNHTAWPDLHQATIRWNSARLAAALLAPPDEAGLLSALDQETDRVMDVALRQQWRSRDFRAQRQRLGELGAQYLNLVRCNEKLRALPMSTIWSWVDQQGSNETTTEGRPTE